MERLDFPMPEGPTKSIPPPRQRKRSLMSSSESSLGRCRLANDRVSTEAAGVGFFLALATMSPGLPSAVQPQYPHRHAPSTTSSGSGSGQAGQTNVSAPLPMLADA